MPKIKLRPQDEDHPQLLARARLLPAHGVIIIKPDGYTYLKVDDAFIHELFPFIAAPDKSLPKYFKGSRPCGAHISIVYHGEVRRLLNKRAGVHIDFTITAFAYTSFAGKNFYILTVDAPALAALRVESGLAPLPQFQSFEIPFHITLGTT